MRSDSVNNLDYQLFEVFWFRFGQMVFSTMASIWTKTCTQALRLENSIQSDIGQNTSNKTQWGVFILSDFIYTVYFAPNGLLGALFME